MLPGVLSKIYSIRKGAPVFLEYNIDENKDYSRDVHTSFPYQRLKSETPKLSGQPPKAVSKAFVFVPLNYDLLRAWRTVYSVLRYGHPIRTANYRVAPRHRSSMPYKADSEANLGRFHLEHVLVATAINSPIPVR
ncbi:hypothetical protein Trydic_g15773 [Trypoxylus dichotomus]